jgi:hypothetical protein
MREHPLNMLAIWVLIAVSETPCHIYGMSGRIYGCSLAVVIPKLASLRSAVRSLERQGTASAHRRRLFGITKRGLAALAAERMSLNLALRGVDQALARQMIERGRMEALARSQARDQFTEAHRS